MTEMRDQAAVTVYGLTTEREVEPLGLDIRRPLLSWKLSSQSRSVRQEAYEIRVAHSLDDLERRLVWHTGMVHSPQSLDQEYQGPPLHSRTSYYWQVRVWTNLSTTPTTWSTPAHWEMGLLSPEDWTARWIEPEQEPTVVEPLLARLRPQELPSDWRPPLADLSHLPPAQYLRRDFQTVGTAVRARLYISAHGLYAAFLNGERVGDNELAPEATAYDDYLMYQAYDIGPQIRSGGANALGVVLADGWWAGRLGIDGRNASYGVRVGLLAQIEIDYSDGSRQVIGSDSSFVASTGPIEYADLLVGQRYDARRRMPGWSSPGFREKWAPVRETPYAMTNLRAQYGPPVRKVASLPVVAVTTSPNGKPILDFGQNIAGRVRFQMTAPRGTEVVLRHAQVLDTDGSLRWSQWGHNHDDTDVYICAGSGDECYEPWFTYRGFRYVEVSGVATVDAEDFKAVALSSVDELSGKLVTDRSDINKLQTNIEWTLRSNCVSILTDNPDRERAGWTGDLGIIAPTAVYNFDLQSFLTRYMRNLAAEQYEDGLVPLTVPFWRAYKALNGLGIPTAAGWGDVCILIPWLLYQHYGDERILAEAWPVMERWLDYVRVTAEGTLTDADRADPDLSAIWRATAVHFGDWLTPSMTSTHPCGFYTQDSARLTAGLVPTLYYLHSAGLAAEIAEILNDGDRHDYYEALTARIRRGFRKAFVRGERLSNDIQGMYVIALAFNAVPELADAFSARLVQLIEDNGGRLDTGFLSTAHLLPVLCAHGERDAAYKQLLRRSNPSWLYQVDREATTIWEMWDSIAEEGRRSMSSYNQPALGSVGSWLFSGAAGISPLEPGFRRVRFDPCVSEALRFVDATYESRYGPVGCRWGLEADRVTLVARLPAGTTGELRLADVESGTLTHQGHPLDNQPDIAIARSEGSSVVLSLGSGEYRFDFRRRVKGAPNF